MKLFVSVALAALAAALVAADETSVIASSSPQRIISAEVVLPANSVKSWPASWELTQKEQLDSVLDTRGDNLHPVVLRGHLAADHVLLHLAHAGDLDSPLDEMFAQEQTATASGEYPQIKVTVAPKFMQHAAAREQVRQGMPTYFATTVPSLELRAHMLQDIQLPRQLDDTDMLSCFGKDHAEYWLRKLYWIQLYTGAAETGMHMHKDNLEHHVWSVQLSGNKTFVFCHPNSHGALGTNGGDGSPVNAFAQDATKQWPSFSDADCYWTTVNPSDLVYWPSLWFHQSRNEGDGSNVLSVAISSMHVRRFGHEAASFSTCRR